MNALFGVEQKLSNLIDDTGFKEIVGRFGKFNLFEALGAARGELRHSNFLAFMLSPARPHGLGAEPLRRVLRALADSCPSDRRVVSSLEFALAELDRATVYRERYAIDILIEVPALRLVVAIENKIGASESNNQLARYMQTVEENYGDWRKMFVFLTPKGMWPSHNHWHPFDYKKLAKIFEEMIGDNQVVKSAEMASIISQYVELIRRRVVEEEELKKLAVGVYEKYKEALDFIFESKPNYSGLHTCLIPIINENENLIVDQKSGTRINFLPKLWDNTNEFNSCPENKWTKTKRMLLFELKTPKPDRVLLSLIVGPGPQELRSRIHEKAKQNKSIFKGATITMGTQWVSIYAKQLLDPQAAAHLDEEGKIENVVKSFQAFLDQELPQLTQACLGIVQPTSLPNIEVTSTA